MSESGSTMDPDTPPASTASTLAPTPVGATGWHPPRRQFAVIATVAILSLFAGASVLAAWRLPPFSGGVETTENAYIRGSTLTVSPQVSGYIVAVDVRDYEHVHAGQVLARVDDRIYKARVEAARATLSSQFANLANARAQLFRAQGDMTRVNELVVDGSVSIRERDQTLATLRQAEAQAGNAGGLQGNFEAQVDGAKAQLRLAEIDLEHTVIRATADGQVGEIGARLGQYVTNGTQLMSLVPAERWVIANFKEAQIAHMAPGQKTLFAVDALDNAVFTGHVERLSPATGSEFALLKAENATGNFVKVPQRIGVRIAIDPNQPLSSRLSPGMSVQVSVETQRAQP